MLFAVPGTEGSGTFTEWEDYKISLQKAKNNSVDNVIRDFQNLMLNLKYENSSCPTYNYIPSDFSIIDHGIKFTELKKKIKKEFEFFDETYFETRNIAAVTIYYTGDAEEDHLVVGNGMSYSYQNLMTDIQKAAEDQTKNVKAGKELLWKVDIMLDCNQAGQCIETAKKLCEVDQRGESGVDDSFGQNAQLHLRIFTACRGEENAYYQPNGFGSLWTGKWVYKNKQDAMKPLKSNNGSTQTPQ